MKPDISNRTDIETVVNTFYDKVKTDDTIGRFFNEVAKVDWEYHLPKMYVFWENAVFYTGGYSGNIIEKHKGIHALSPLQPEHFQHWLKLFNETVDELFVGENANQIKQKALSLATVIEIKVLN
jgi:hemoglobin